jgi:hypothetical protein
MKRWLIIIVPLLLVSALMFVRPPSFTTNKSTVPVTTNTSGATGATSTIGVKPGISGGGDDEENQKPAYGGHEKDNYGKD